MDKDATIKIVAKNAVVTIFTVPLVLSTGIQAQPSVLMVFAFILDLICNGKGTDDLLNLWLPLFII